MDLTREGQEAQRIKEKVPILVVVGNPPYSVSSENKSDFIENLMSDYKEDVRTERNIQPLSDDYIKFIRFAHWKIEQAGKGIIGFITNNSYLSGVIHRGMRRKLLKTFDEIFILNLHGSSRIGEKTPEGGKDENVFDIQQGVAIVLYLKQEKPQKDKKVYYADLWGLREGKYKYLFRNDLQSTEWQELTPTAPYYFFVPKDFTLQEEYKKFWKVTDIFNKFSIGVVTSRDHFVVGFNKNEIIQRLRIFTGSLPDELVKKSLKIKDTRTWNLSEARKAIKSEKLYDKIYPYSFRIFDERFICYDPYLIERDRMHIMKSFTYENLALSTTRQEHKIGEFGAFISSFISDYHYLSQSTYFFPLYLYKQEEEKKHKSKSTIMMVFEPKAEYKTKEPNFTPEFIKAVSTLYKKEPTTEEIFYYIYAVLYSSTYRKRYEEFLKIDFPRIPLPSNNNVFKKLSNLGKELVKLHLFKSPELAETGIAFPKGNSNTVEKVFYDEKNQRVFINKDQYFEGITREVWEYRIGAYQVMHKYLKDRKKRRLSLDEINQYMKMAKAIRLTIELQERIDEVYRQTEI